MGFPLFSDPFHDPFIAGTIGLLCGLWLGVFLVTSPKKVMFITGVFAIYAGAMFLIGRG